MAVLTSIELQETYLINAPGFSDFHIFKPVITGFNTDIEYEGIVYHVQTEDKGLDSPLILSLVYAGGAILASKRSRYEDLIEAGFNEDVLTERLKRQHRLICAAINAGRIEDLKRMGAKAQEEATIAANPAIEAPGAAQMNESVASGADEEDFTIEIITSDSEADTDESFVNTDKSKEKAASGGGSRNAQESPYTVYDPRRQAPLSEVVQAESGLTLTILDAEDFRGGETFTIRILFENNSGNKQKPVVGETVSVKILGTAFRPQIYTVKTERDGVATVSAAMPNFTSGRAAVLVRAVVKGETIELRRVIHPAT
jgi:hypothetical protein